MTDVLNIEMRDTHPLRSGRRHMPRRLSMLDASSSAVYQAYGSGAAAKLPRVVDQRFFSGSRAARIVSTYFSDEFSLNILDSLWGTDYMEVIGNENEWYVLSLRLSGDTLESVCNRDYRLGAYSCYMVHYGRGMNYIFRSVTEQPLIEVCTTFRPAMLADKLGLSRDELHDLLHPGNDAADPWFSRCRMMPEMGRIVCELRDASPSEPTYRLYAEAKTLELISLYLAQLQAQAKPREGGDALSRDLHCLQRVKHYLEENYDREPALDHLSRMAGFNRKKLTNGFKSEFGKTIREYHQEVRMEIAKTLFRERGASASVSVVADKIGYTFPGNFAKAFHKYAGISPKAYVKKTLDERRQLKPPAP